MVCTKENWSWEEAEVNLWTSTSSERVMTFYFRNPKLCNPNILAILSLETLMTICDNFSETIELESGEKCYAHHTTNSGKWKTCGTMQRGRPDSETWKWIIISFGLLKKCMGRSWRLEQDKMGSDTSQCWLTSNICSGSFRLWMVKAMLIDSIGVMISVKTILTCMIAAISRMEFGFRYFCSCR